MKRKTVLLSSAIALLLFAGATFVYGKQDIPKASEMRYDESSLIHIRKTSPTSCESLIGRKFGGEDVFVPSYCLDTFIEIIAEKK